MFFSSFHPYLGCIPRRAYGDVTPCLNLKEKVKKLKMNTDILIKLTLLLIYIFPYTYKYI